MASQPTFVTSANAIITVTLQGVTFPSYIKTWTSYQGGDKTAATSILQPGGVNQGLAVPGVTTRSNVVVTLPYTWDIHAMVEQIEAAVNGGMTAGFTPTDANGNPNSNTPVSRNGLMKEPMFPSFDAKTSDPVFMTLTMECNT